MKVAVLLGGRSSEREISIMSGNMVLQALRSRGVDAHPFDPAVKPLFDLQQEGFERCFIALHGRYGEDGTIQGALELMGIPYTGAGVATSAIAINKETTKRIWLSYGLATPNYQVVYKKQLQVKTLALQQSLLDHIGLPMIVKPLREGSSLGTTKVLRILDLESALKIALEHDDTILCERLIVGEEVTCGILGSGQEIRALPVILIKAPEGNYNYENKYFNQDTEYLVPSGLPTEEIQAIQNLSISAYQALDCRSWGRVDLMLDKQSRIPYLLELNTIPGMTDHSLVPKAAQVAGMSYTDLCMYLLQGANLDHSAPSSVLINGG
jgi:D-alanine-D-alanine ligase